MRTVLTPRELAQAIGVSESSLKRWANDGLIKVSRTAGGHRRISHAEAIRFIRETRATVVRPDLLGLPDLAVGTIDPRPNLDVDGRLYRYLHDGQAAEARGVLLAEYLRGVSVADLCDGPVREALQRIGELWQHSDAGIMVEHRATDICLQALNQLRLKIEPLETAPVAVGGAPAGDAYLLPSLIAAAVLADVGYQTTNLGPDTPIKVLVSAAAQYHARIVWLSVSSGTDPHGRAGEIRQLVEALEPLGAHVIVGGRASGEIPLPPHPRVRRLSSMAELAEFGAKVRQDDEPAAAQAS